MREDQIGTGEIDIAITGQGGGAIGADEITADHLKAAVAPDSESLPVNKPEGADLRNIDTKIGINFIDINIR